jgi:hypothetical protein
MTCRLCDAPAHLHNLQLPDHHDTGCPHERRAPVLFHHRGGKSSGTIAWSEHEEAWREYSRRYGNAQSAEHIAERGGFGHGELLRFLGRDPLTFRLAKEHR